MDRQFNPLKIYSAAIAIVFSILSNAAFAQEHYAYNQLKEEKPALEATTADEGAYYRSFQAVVFKRLNGNISVNVEKAPHENITIRLYDMYGKLLNEATMGKKELVTKYYDLSGMKKGNYTFVVSSQRKTFRKEVTIE